jgi:CheY-like chemotaxis protein
MARADKIGPAGPGLRTLVRRAPQRLVQETPCGRAPGLLTLAAVQGEAEVAVSERVLIVDDNEDVRRILALRLSLAGFEVSDAADGRAGLLALRGGRWDLVLLDLVMPELDGFEFLNALRADTAESPPVVVITQYDDAVNRQRALALGAARYVGKSSALDRAFPGALRAWVDEFKRPTLASTKD